jgi:hypothetical protein
MTNQAFAILSYLIVFSCLVFLGYTIIRSLIIFKALKKFVTAIQKEIKTELTNEYMKLMRGEIEVPDFYEKQEWLGQLYSKIFEDYKNGIMKNYFKPRKGRMKVK